jgi:hypothetical protein
MNLLSQEFIRRSGEQRSASTALLDSADFGTNAKKQALATIGYISANMYEALAEMLEFQSGTEKVSEHEARLHQIQQTNSAIRTAAAAGFATGDWSKFDGLIGELGTS